MKRNKEKSRAMRSGQSPYHRYGKRPYRYSEAYRQWARTMGRTIARDQEREAARNAARD